MGKDREEEKDKETGKEKDQSASFEGNGASSRDSLSLLDRLCGKGE